MSGSSTCRVFDIQRFSIHDGPGIRTTVFLAGCALRCGWCQNPEAFRGEHATLLKSEAVMAEVLKDLDYYAVSGGGLTVSGGEPLLHLAPVQALLMGAKQHGLHTCVQTSGAVSQAHLAAVLDLVDLFQFDLKHMDSARHKQLTGAGTESIHANAAFLQDQGATVQFRMPLLPGVNDDATNLDQTADFLLGHSAADVRLVPYHRLYLDKYAALELTPGLLGLVPPTAHELQRATERLAARGLVVLVDG